MIGKIIIFIDLDFLKLRDNPKDYHYQYQFKKIIEKVFSNYHHLLFSARRYYFDWTI